MHIQNLIIAVLILPYLQYITDDVVEGQIEELKTLS